MATLETLAEFNGTNGKTIYSGLIRDSEGNLYGTTQAGGQYNQGVVYKINYDSTTQTYDSNPTALVSFNTANGGGAGANGGLVTDSAGNLYGATQAGGTNGNGAIYKIAYDGVNGTYSSTPQILASFNVSTTGQTPLGALVRDDAGNLYGTAQSGGPTGGGTIFKLAYDSGTNTYANTPTVVVAFDANSGSNPQEPAEDLIIDAAGNLYGTTRHGPADNTVFKIAYDKQTDTYSSTPETLASLGVGVGATGRLTMDAAGNIYGTTQSGGTASEGSVFKISFDSQTGTYGAKTDIATLSSAAGGAAYPNGVIVDAAGNLYGTSQVGGADGNGAVFKISYDGQTETYGAPTTLVSFSSSKFPSNRLIADSQGRLYGTTADGGPDGGTVFRISDAGFVCFTTGTRIRTQRGEVPVEALRVGERAVTASGEHRAIRWIGHRRLAPHHQPAPQAAHPVRIAAHAFGGGRPARDLFVSPAHAIAVDLLGEVLIPACRLINGTTITQEEADEVTYWHVELDSHDILLAEGLPAESYLDCGNRRFFANAEATDLMAAPDARPEGALPFCRPFHEAGPLVDLVRARLAARAEDLGWRTVEETFARLHLVADGQVIRPDVEGLTARFVLPADARAVRLVSDTSVPAHVVPGASDDRRLGVAVAALTLDDGLTGARAIALDDARLGAGFHAIEGEARWTDGAALLPAELWAGCRGTVFLRVEFARPALPRWVGPQAVEPANVRRQA